MRNNAAKFSNNDTKIQGCGLGYIRKWYPLNLAAQELAELFELPKDEVIPVLWTALGDGEIASRGWVCDLNGNHEPVRFHGVKRLPVDWYFYGPDLESEDFSKDTLYIEQQHLVAYGVELRLSDVNNVFCRDDNDETEEKNKSADLNDTKVVRPLVGRTQKWDWEGALCEVIMWADLDGLPSGSGAKTEISNYIAQYFIDTQDSQPSPSQTKAVASRIVERIKKGR